MSSQSPDKAVDPTTRTGRAKIQATVDQLAGVFVADVARNRDVAEATVVSDFGQGWVLVGASAVDAGLADGITTFENVVAGAPETGGPRGSIDKPGTGQQEDTENMETVNVNEITATWLQDTCPDVVAAVREGFVPEAQVVQDAAALQAKLAEAEAEAGVVAGDAVSAERERVLGIQTAAHGLGLGSLVATLVANPEMTLEGAKARLFEAVQAKRKGTVDALAGDEAAMDTPDASVDAAEQGSADAAMVKAATQSAGDTVFGPRQTVGS